jgi:hypothetical protein
MVVVEDVISDEKSCRIRLVGAGTHSVRIVLRDPDLRITPCCVQASSPQRECTVNVNLTGMLELEFDLT